jgi:glyoxylase-like metal-dependent hydrolase (beta-lactamase superfamily II)
VDQIDVVVLTHAHPDHIGGLMEGGSPLFPGARYIMGALEHDFWSSEDRLAAPAAELEYTTGRLFQATLGQLRDRFRFITPGDDVAPGIGAVEAYGHTPGHPAFHVESRGRGLLVWGDCAHHEVASLARPEWHALFDMDKLKGAATRRRIYEMAAAERLPVVEYHTSFPSVGFVRKQGVGYRWVPVTDQLSV